MFKNLFGGDFEDFKVEFIIILLYVYDIKLFFKYVFLCILVEFLDYIKKFFCVVGSGRYKNLLSG